MQTDYQHLSNLGEQERNLLKKKAKGVAIFEKYMDFRERFVKVDVQ